MAQVRTSGKQAAARKAARERAVERAADFRRRQEQLEELAAEYFVAADAVDGINEDAETRIQKIRDEAAAAIVEAEERAQTIITRMLVKRRKPATPAVDAETPNDAEDTAEHEHASTGEQHAEAA
jgi:division protein CdvB (Snf7/Vps24/ESCRT-III family)